MNLSDFAAKIKAMLLNHLDDPTTVGFKKNSRGMLQKKIRAPFFIKKDDHLEKHGNITIFYAEQNPHGISIDAQIVRSGI